MPGKKERLGPTIKKAQNLNKPKNIKESLVPTIPSLKEMSNMSNNQNQQLLKNKEIKNTVNKAMSTVITEGISKVVKGGARLNLLSMMFSPTSATAEPVVDPETGVNRFTGETVFTPMFKRK